MSGGAFDYNQQTILRIAEDIQEVIDKNGKEKTREEIKAEGWRDDNWYKKYPEDLFHYKYTDDVIEEMKKGVAILKIAYVYAQRIDWLLSSDDSEETFLKRIRNDLKELGYE